MEQAIRLSASESRSVVNHQEWNRSYSSNTWYDQSTAGRPRSAAVISVSGALDGFTKVPATIASPRPSRFASVRRSEQKKRKIASTSPLPCSAGSSATSLTAVPAGAAMGLPRPVAVQAVAGEAQVDAHEGEDHHREGGHRDGGGALAGPAQRDAGVQVAGVDDPGDQRPGLLRIPAPEAAPGLVGPHAAHDDADAEERPAGDHGAVGDVLEAARVGQERLDLRAPASGDEEAERGAPEQRQQ